MGRAASLLAEAFLHAVRSGDGMREETFLCSTAFVLASAGTSRVVDGRSHDPRALSAHHRASELHIEQLEPRRYLAGAPLITEFLASNDNGLRDGDGNASDWIEIHNAGDMPVDLCRLLPHG